MRNPCSSVVKAKRLGCGVLFGVVVVALLSHGETARAQGGVPPGKETTIKTKTLNAGAKFLQRIEPLRGFTTYLVGIHPLRDDLNHQMVAHHFCHQVNEDFTQCVLYDGNTANSRLNGIEYIISEKTFGTLPAEEKKHWHPHNYEILSGQLVAPGLPAVAEREALRGKMNSYGKTWHVWMTGGPGHAAHALPLGEPRLAWSLNKDGEAKPEVLKLHASVTGIDLAKKKAERDVLSPLARTQEGVDVFSKK